MGNINQLQANLYQLAKEIHDICEKYDIQYFLAGGTALGTVRNHCFLPWDDDIDMYITRDNWNKLRHILETEQGVLPEGRSLIYNENNRYYHNTIPRYVDNTTTLIYKSQALPGQACGQHIELLIMDPMPNDEKEREEFIKLMKVYTELLSPYFVVNKNLSIDAWKEHYELYEHYCKRVDEEGETVVLKELEEKLQSYDTDDCDTFCMRWGIDILMYKKADFGKGRLERFEEDDFYVGESAEGIFRIAYGDSWMYVPEYDEQVVHFPLQDITRPFCEYTERYLPKINRDSVFNKYKKVKRNDAKLFYNRRRLDETAAKLKVAVESPSICENLEANADELIKLLENKEYIKLSEAFDEYRKLQFNQHVRRYKIIVPISDKNICTLLYNSIEQGKYYEANKYLNIRKMQDEPFSEELKKAERKMNACRELSIARYDHKNAEEVQLLIDKYSAIYPDLLDIYRAQIWINELEAKSESDYYELAELCEKALEIYPFDGEIMASLAHAKKVCGEEEFAMKLYHDSIRNTRNGLIWEKVKEETGISRIDEERKVIEEKNNGSN